MEWDSKETIYRGRFEIAKRDQSDLRESLVKLEEKLKLLSNQVSRKPKETLQDINKAILDLETKYASNRDDKTFQSKLLPLNQKKKSLGEIASNQAEIDQLKQQREVYRANINEKEKQINTLTELLRKNALAKKLGSNPDRFVVETVTLPEDKVDMIVGINGVALRQKEDSFGVSIEQDRVDDNIISIIGPKENVVAAIEAIHKSKLTLEEDVPLSEETLVCLSKDQSQIIEIQNSLVVRLDLSRVKGTCKIMGTRDAIEATKKKLRSIDSLRQIHRVDATTFKTITTKGSAILHSLEENNFVKIDITSRENCELAVIGIRERVLKVIQELRTYNEEFTEIIYSDKHKLNGLFMINQGEPKKKFSRDYNVIMHIEKAAPGSASGKSGILYIKGLKFKVAVAKDKILELLDDFDNNSVTLTIPEDVMPLLIGKNGIKINSLRDSFPDGGIDVDKTIVRVSGSDAKKRQQMVDTIIDFVNTNFIKILKLTEENCAFVRGPKYAELKQQLSSLPKLSVDADIDKRELRLRGIKASVDEAFAQIELCWDGIFSDSLILDEEDCASLMNSTPPSVVKEDTASSSAGGSAIPCSTSSVKDNLIFNPIKYIEDRFGVSFNMFRKECKVSIGGKKNQVLLAKEYMHGILRGDTNCNSVLVPVESMMFATLIGKGGSNLRRMEGESSVKIDLLKSRDMLRLRGFAENILAARDKLLDFLDEAKITSNIDISKFSEQSNLKRSDLDNVIAKCERVFELMIDDKIESLQLKGTRKSVLDTKQYIEDYINQESSFKIHLSQSQIVEFDMNRRYWDFHNLMVLHPDVNVVLNLVENYLEVKGPQVPMCVAKKEVYSFVATLAPSEMTVLKLPSRCIRHIFTSKQIRMFTNQLGSDAKLLVDRISLIVVISGSNSFTMTHVCDKIKELIRDYEKQYYDYELNESTMAAISSRGAFQKIQTALSSKVILHLNRESNFIEMHSSDEKNLTDARHVLLSELAKFRDICIDIAVDEDLVGVMIGRKGLQIQKIRTEVAPAIIDYKKDSRVLTVSGLEEHVKAAEQYINKFLDGERHRENTHYKRELWVPGSAVPMLIGVEGRMCKEIQSKSNTRIDFNKLDEKATIKGTEENCALAVEIILQKLNDEGFDTTYQPDQYEDDAFDNKHSDGVKDEKEEHDRDYDRDIHPVEDAKEVVVFTSNASTVTTKDGRILDVPPGASEEMIKKMVRDQEELNLSKSALKRKRKKEKAEVEAAAAAAATAITKSNVSVSSAPAQSQENTGTASLTSNKEDDLNDKASSELSSTYTDISTINALSLGNSSAHTSIVVESSSSGSSSLPTSSRTASSTVNIIQNMMSPVNKGFDKEYIPGSPSIDPIDGNSILSGLGILNLNSSPVKDYSNKFIATSLATPVDSADSGLNGDLYSQSSQSSISSAATHSDPVDSGSLPPATGNLFAHPLNSQNSGPIRVSPYITSNVTSFDPSLYQNMYSSSSSIPTHSSFQFFQPSFVAVNSVNPGATNIPYSPNFQSFNYLPQPVVHQGQFATASPLQPSALLMPLGGASPLALLRPPPGLPPGLAAPGLSSLPNQSYQPQSHYINNGSISSNNNSNNSISSNISSSTSVNNLQTSVDGSYFVNNSTIGIGSTTSLGNNYHMNNNSGTISSSNPNFNASISPNPNSNPNPTPSYGKYVPPHQKYSNLGSNNGSKK